MQIKMLGGLSYDEKFEDGQEELIFVGCGGMVDGVEVCSSFFVGLLRSAVEQCHTMALKKKELISLGAAAGQFFASRLQDKGYASNKISNTSS